MVLDETLIRNKISEYKDLIISTRRYLHEHPELSQQEFETKKLVISHINQRGLPYMEAGINSVIATLDTGKPGKTLLLRADMDALPLEESEENLCQKKVSVSKTKGVCHACGHDGHTAMLIGAMHILCDISDQLCGKILFCFEEAEETMAGIDPVMKVLEPYPIDGAWGIHLTAMHPAGKISIEQGAVMAGANRFEVVVHGKGGHGSRPDQLISPVFGAAYILSALPSAWVNEIDVTKTVTLGIGLLQGGQQENVIPDTVTFAGSMRYFDEQAGLDAVEAFQRICESTAQAHRCTIEYKSLHTQYPPPVWNDAVSAARAQNAVKKILGEECLIHGDPWFGSESMALYLKKYSGAFAFVGIHNEELGTGAVHHNEHFDIDESVLPMGAAVTVQYACDFLNEK